MKPNCIVLKTLCSLIGALSISAVSAQTYQNVAVETEVHDQHETSIAINPSNPLHILATWNDFRSNVASQPGYAFTNDGFTNWSTALLTNSPSWPSLDFPNKRGFDPAAAFDRSNRAFYCFVAEAPNPPIPGIPTCPCQALSSPKFLTEF